MTRRKASEKSSSCRRVSTSCGYASATMVDHPPLFGPRDTTKAKEKPLDLRNDRGLHVTCQPECGDWEGGMSGGLVMNIGSG
jgi:hypothetical protein